MVDDLTSSSTKKKKKNVFKRIAKGMAIKRKKKHPDDASVMGVAMSDSVHSMINGETQVSVSASAPPIQIILLLMDPNSRRFELLQLEFDSVKALVSDVLLQIEQSATETTLRDMVYGGVCDRTGMEMISSCKLSRFCSAGKNEIVLAMPKGMGGRETAVLAKPILEDEKVVEMLRPCGVNLTSKKKSSKAVLPKIDENEQTKAAPRSSQLGLRTETKKKSNESYFPTQILGILIAAAILFITQHHNKITRPIQSGLCLMPGEWISRCGIWELIPGNRFCDTSVSKLFMGKDGKLRYFDKAGDGKLEEVWSVGAECVAENDEQCVVNLDCQGAAFSQDGNKWYVEVNGDRKPLMKGAIQQFT